MKPRTVRLLALLVALAPLPADAQAVAPTWPADLYDPGATAEGAADLILPMPCGGAMAFQRVDIPMEAADPLADVRLRLGQSDEAMGFSEYLRPVWLRGGFAAEDGQSTHFFIARYELTSGQYRALHGDCAAPTRKDRVVQGGLSWFAASDVARTYTEWLYANVPDALPRQDGALPFLRLPSETEWEYAARGGARIDANQFSARRFFAEGELAIYAYYFAPGNSRGKVGPVGLRKPNPLGLFDVYGNAEELMLDPYRLNVLGREHGQTGGVVTRGGSAQSTEDQIYSAQRSEYPPFSADTGKPMAPPTFGARLVLSVPVTTSDREVTALRDRWLALAGAGAGQQGAPIASLDDLIADEADPRRQHALENLKADLRKAQEGVLTAMRQSARSTLIAGAIFVGGLREGRAAIADKEFNLGIMKEMSRVSGKDATAKARAVAQIESHTRQLAALHGSQKSYLLSYASTLQTLTTDIPEAEDRTAFIQLRSELDLARETRLVALLDDFWRDLAIYRTRPDLDSAALLDLALK